MVGKTPLRSAVGVVVLVAIATVAMCLAGCGGDGPPRSDSDLVVRSRGGGGHAPDFWSVEVERSGWCRAFAQSAPAGEPVGYFEAQLDAALMRRTVGAMEDAREAHLQPQYPTGEPDAGQCSIDIPTAKGFRTVVFAWSIPRLIPEALKPLYRGTDKGLLVDALNVARRRPKSAMAVSLSAPATTYRVGEPIASESIIRSVGTGPVAFPSTSVQELATVQSEVDLLGEPMTPIDSVLQDFGPWREPYPRGDAPLSPQARDDLPNIAILAPGEEYRIPVADGPVAPAAGEYRLRVLVWLRPRYALEASDEALGAPLPPVVMDSVQVPITVVD